MPRVCTVCSHAYRAEIERLLVSGEESIRNIAARFTVSSSALTRHKADHLTKRVQEARATQDAAEARDVMAELDRVFVRVNRLFDACDRWLQDPVNPDLYEIGPRAEELDVVYTVLRGEGRVRKKERLSRLLARIEEAGEGRGTIVHSVELRTADPRELILKTANQLRGLTELLSRILTDHEIDQRLLAIEQEAGMVPAQERGV